MIRACYGVRHASKLRHGEGIVFEVCQILADPTVDGFSSVLFASSSNVGLILIFFWATLLQNIASRAYVSQLPLQVLSRPR